MTYELIHLYEAQKFYEENFEYEILSPLVSKDGIDFKVKQSICEITMPKNANPFKLDLEYEYYKHYLIGSAEQSLINRLINEHYGKCGLPFLEHIEIFLQKDKLYQCFTPCFRNEYNKSYYHFNMFYKIELFSFHESKNKAKKFLKERIQNAMDYNYTRFLPKCFEIVKTNQGKDIFLNGIEIGSYGIRKINLSNYIEHRGLGKVEDKIVYVVYGTGLAEPRFTMASKASKGTS